jgi:hypothetical protein
VLFGAADEHRARLGVLLGLTADHGSRKLY